LRFFQVAKIPGFQHLAIILYHLNDGYWIVFAVIRAISINAADVFLLVRQFLQPWTTRELLPGVRAYPYLTIADIPENIRAVFFPPVYLTG